MRVVGIDEAGRGCVLGPLVVAGFACDLADVATIVEAGAGDSKRMSAKRRARVATALEPLGEVEVRRIPATAIDAGNLNTLEEEAIVSILVALRPDLAILDALGHPSAQPAMLDRLRRALAPHGLDPELRAEPKADAHHPPVGAASVFAKTRRDDALDALRADHAPFGSGYPSDPVTRGWLRDLHAAGTPWPAFVRTRWGTVRDLESPPS